MVCAALYLCLRCLFHRDYFSSSLMALMAVIYAICFLSVKDGSKGRNTKGKG